MISPVSMANVTKARPYFGEAPANILDRPGAFTKPQEEIDAPVEEKKKSGGAGKKALWTAIGLLAIAASLVALKKFDVTKVITNAEELSGLKFYQPKKISHYLAKAGEFISKYTWDPIAKLLTRKGANVAE